MRQHAAKIQPVDAGHPHVAQYHCDGRIVIKEIEGIPDGSRRDCGVTMMKELRRQRFGKIKIVVDYQDFPFESHGVWFCWRVWKRRDGPQSCVLRAQPRQA